MGVNEHIRKYGEWPMSRAQREYIMLLSNYESTGLEDKMDIDNFLKILYVKRIEDLTKKEASALIRKLLERPVKYTFICGMEKWIQKEDYNKYTIFGEMDACVHDCPDPKINSDVNNCLAFIKWHDVAQDQDVEEM